MTTLSGVISEFGGSGSIPNNMRSYLKLGAFLNWNGGVAEHDNNSAIPYSGTLNLSNFASPADRDFVSDSYSVGQDIYFDFFIGDFQSAEGYAAGGNQLQAAGLTALSQPIGSAGSRIRIGKATYGSVGQTATVNGIYDFYNYGSVGFIFQLQGDQRRSGWGGTGTAGGTSGAAPTSITVTVSGTPTTLSFASSSVPLGSYSATYNTTTWTWLGSTVGLNNLPASFTFSVSIF